MELGSLRRNVMEIFKLAKTANNDKAPGGNFPTITLIYQRCYYFTSPLLRREDRIIPKAGKGVPYKDVLQTLEKFLDAGIETLGRLTLYERSQAAQISQYRKFSEESLMVKKLLQKYEG
ncbi:unnamed protein product [Ceratitis capitata]|uniref:(Mediterranean fruit fly) hypothetical protein n=1 Tax=Ceratitis capitata TaxID=7213 RepID=A0A811UEN4_CERCA|nr:unnamed protein product [Ceratitis capitata]